MLWLTLQQLKSSNIHKRLKAVETLAQSKDPRASDAILKSLSDTHETVRILAIRLLGDWGNPSFASSLLPLLNDVNLSVRLATVDALKRLKAFEVLVCAFKNSEPAVRSAAIRACKGVRSSFPFMPHLGTALVDESPGVRHAALEIFEEQGSMDQMLFLLGDRNSEIRMAAANALMRQDAPRFGQQLVPLLQDEDERIRTAVVHFFIKNELFDELGIAMRNTDERIRFSVTQALRRIAGAQSIQLLTFALQDEKEYIQHAAIEGLAAHKAIDPLIHLLKQPNSKLCFQVIQALSSTGDPAAIEPLTETLGHPDPWICEETAYALENLGWKPTDPELRAKQALAVRSWTALADIGSPAIPFIVKLLATDLFPEAARCLGEIGDHTAAPALMSMLNDQNHERVDAAIDALRKIKAPDASKALEQLLKDCRFREKAAEALRALDINPEASPLWKTIEIRCKNTGAVLHTVRYSTLEGANLQKLVLENADFYRTNLRGAFLNGSDLRNANLRLADLSGASIRRVNLFAATLDEAIAVKANFEFSNMVQTSLEKTNLEDANLQGTFLRGATLKLTNLNGANLRNAALEEANLIKVFSNGQTRWPSGFALYEEHVASTSPTAVSKAPAK